ncbi:hypothetical protein [Novipirellula aureliae]|uniref:hypothetical protein n=1 Tax=Novipirellula aureliae TaxID=2527966 RepID=UPI0018CDCF87|nr:hypothetical protein [Novipirellula aureliae]
MRDHNQAADCPVCLGLPLMLIVVLSVASKTTLGGQTTAEQEERMGDISPQNSYYIL